jgi:hypothetical protein
MPTYRRKSDIRFRVLDGEAVVLRQEDAEVVVLNEVGTRILQLVDQGGSEEQVLALLLEEFEVGEEDLARDVREFLAEMVENEILEAVDAPPEAASVEE